METNTFWIVWNPRGAKPTVRHDSKGKAVAEAQRLARAHNSHEFVVLEAIESYQVSDLVRTVFTDDPF